MQHSKILVAGLLGVVFLTSTGCRRVRNIYTRTDEIRMGTQFVTAFNESAEGSKIIRNGPMVNRLQRVALPIIEAARKDWDVPYSVTLIKDNEINAFAVPGGPMYVNTGLMQLATSDDELASVLAHEVSHIVKRHSAQQLSDAAVKQGVAGILFGRSSADVRTVVGLTLDLKDREFSRGDEAQSDEYGFKYLVAAGYNVRGMASMFTKMQESAAKSNEKLAFLSTHPLTRKRIEAAEKRAESYENGTWKAPK
ncbi:MAG: M48 family metalloprotease [Armatimonadaceae bacterium]